MQFEFDVTPLFKCEITKLDGPSIRQVSNFCRRSFAESYLPTASKNENICIVIDRMGEASAKSQGLDHIITTYSKMCESDHILYIMKDSLDRPKEDVIIGILKVGKKRLFLMDMHDHQYEIVPVCILDFYVHELYQRKGCGKKLYDYMLQDQNVEAQNLAFDRPSPKLLAFLNKHYHLSNPLHQRNNFTVYEGIFSNLSAKYGEDCTKKQTIGRQSESEKIRMLEKEEEMQHSRYRKSFSPTKAKQKHNSVASVVFGKTYSPENDENLFEIKLRNYPQRDNALNRNPVDSSFNIFGIHSPMTQY